MVSKEERIVRLLQYLKKYTDKDNPTSTALMDYYFEQKGMPDFFGPKASRRKSRRAMIKELVRVLNSDLYGNPLPKEEWRLTYDGLEENGEETGGYIQNLYYVQPFSKNDVNTIKDCIRQNPALDDAQKKMLTEKITSHFSNENYESSEAFIQRGATPTEKKKHLKEKAKKRTRLQQMTKQKIDFD